jgi:glycosyltransferase involved in cell wall biosynthesis
MKLEFLGKFYDNHSLSIVNRNIVVALHNQGINVKIIPLDSYNPVYCVDKKQVQILKQLENIEQESDIQVRHTYPPVWAWPTSKKTKVVFIQPWEFTKAPFEWQYKFETFADALVVPSKFTASVFTQGGINPEKLYVVPNGYDDSLFNLDKADDSSVVRSLGIDPNKFNFVYVGNSQWRKGLDILLNAWPAIFAKSDNARLIIKDNPKVYGKNNILNEIIKIQYKTGCAEIIYIDEDLPDSSMAALYKASKVIVHPYRAEGFAMHVQEAVACGCIPVISSNGPTDDFIPSNKGFKIPVESRPININDPNIFALKPGDSSTLMSTHTFANEPSLPHLQKILQHIYHNHYKTNLFEQIKDITSLTTWTVAATQYLQVLKNVYDNKQDPNRLRAL